MSAAREATDASLDDATVAKMQQTFVGGAGRHAAAAELEPTQGELVNLPDMAPQRGCCRIRVLAALTCRWLICCVCLTPLQNAWS